MPKLKIITREGVATDVEASAGISVMEAIRDNGFDELLALCGGCRSCATCHVYVDGRRDALPPILPDEDELLDSSNHRQPNRVFRARSSWSMRSTGCGSRLRRRIDANDRRGLLIGVATGAPWRDDRRSTRTTHFDGLGSGLHILRRRDRLAWVYIIEAPMFTD